MRKKEQEFCTKLEKWLNYKMPVSCFIEAKVAYDDKPFNFRTGFKPHQLKTLITATKSSFAYKISDRDMELKPFDLIFGRKIATYVAIMWVRRGNKTFYLIDPIAVQGLIDDGHKSLSEDMAAKIAEVTGTLA
jgi:hypothetical protein